jgi:hydroxymethylglutaryl-CoA lyase
MFEAIPAKVKIVEVGPRDGLQNEKAIISLEDKLHYISLLVDAGLNTIETTSFVRSDKIPQMSDARDLFTQVKKLAKFNQLNFPCLVPNLKGYELAKEVGVSEIALFSATSDDFTQKNINCTVEESFQRMQFVAKLAQKDNVKIRGYISTAFGCPYAGKTSSQQLVKIVEKFLKLGVYEISIGDTIGVATPKQVFDYLKDIFRVAKPNQIAMHFHDTYGMGITNILTSLESGVSTFDSSSGGLGGCPYARGATGNIATEDVLYLLNSLGVSTGVDMEKLKKASTFILNKVNKKTPSKYLQSTLDRSK